MLHLLGLTRPRVEAAELLHMVAVAAHVLKLLICSELVHLHPVRYVLVLGAECAVSYKACGHPCIAQFSIMEEILLVLALIHEQLTIALRSCMTVQDACLLWRQLCGVPSMHVAVARGVVSSHAASNRDGCFGCGIPVAVCLVVGVAVDVKVVAIDDALVLLYALFGLHVVEDCEEHLSRDETV